MNDIHSLSHTKWNCKYRKIMHEITKSMLPLIPWRSVVDELRCLYGGREAVNPSGDF